MNKVLVLILLLIFVKLFLQSCRSSKPNDFVDNPQKIVKAVNSYLSGCPDFFYNPSFWKPPGWTEVKNKTGAVAWTSSGVVSCDYHIETKSSYITRLNNATISNQQSYSEYVKNCSSGFPGIKIGSYDDPEAKYQAGFVCYVLTHNAYNDAGFPMVTPIMYWNPKIFLEDNHFRKLSEKDIVRVGDIVAYDFNNDNIYDHLGIIVDISANNKRNWKVVSATGLLDVFKCSAVTHRLGIFATPDSGGAFSWWTSTPDNNVNPAKFYIYYK